MKSISSGCIYIYRYVSKASLIRRVSVNVLERDLKTDPIGLDGQGGFSGVRLTANRTHRLYDSF